MKKIILSLFFVAILVLGIAAYQFACCDMLIAFYIPILSDCKCIYEVRDIAITNPYRVKVYYPIIKSFIKSIEYEDRHSPQFELEHIVPAYFDTTDFLIEDIVWLGEPDSVVVSNDQSLWLTLLRYFGMRKMFLFLKTQ